MLLYLVRHAHAVSDQPDGSRALSSEGIDYTQRLAQLFQQNGAFAPIQVWHSPLRRARETAEILVGQLKLGCGVVETSGLLPEDQPEQIVGRLTSEKKTPLALVGHEPYLSSLATLLVQGRPYPVAFEMRKGAVLALERTGGIHQETGDPRWVVLWHLGPALLEVRPAPSHDDSLTRNRPVR